MKNKKIYKILILIGIIPLIIPVVMGLYNAITGFAGLCFGCEKTYGISALFDTILLYSVAYWPTYILGLTLIVVSIIKSKK